MESLEQRKIDIINRVDKLGKLFIFYYNLHQFDECKAILVELSKNKPDIDYMISTNRQISDIIKYKPNPNIIVESILKYTYSYDMDYYDKIIEVSGIDKGIIFEYILHSNFFSTVNNLSKYGSIIVKSEICFLHKYKEYIMKFKNSKKFIQGLQKIIAFTKPGQWFKKYSPHDAGVYKLAIELQNFLE